MDNISILVDLFFQLEDHCRKYFECILHLSAEKLQREISMEEVEELSEKIKVYFVVLKKEIQKVKSLKRKEIEVDKLKNQSKKYDERIIQLNKVMMSSIKNLRENNQIFKLSSTNKYVVQSNFMPRDLINFTMRINTNYLMPKGGGGIIPGSFLNPFPTPEIDMKNSFLKFNFDESLRMKMPVIYPTASCVKKGSLLEFKYQVDDKDVFFKYTFSNEIIPSYFSGELYNQNSPPILDKNLTIKVCACKFGFMDSQINSKSFVVSDEDDSDSMIKKMTKFVTGARRPDTIIINDGGGFNPIQIGDLDDDSSSHYTPGSIYQISLHRRESNILDNDDGL